jgi:hypothetical protein
LGNFAVAIAYRLLLAIRHGFSCKGITPKLAMIQLRIEDMIVLGSQHIYRIPSYSLITEGEGREGAANNNQHLIGTSPPGLTAF